MTSFVTSAGSAYILSVLFGRTEIPLPRYFLGLCATLPEVGDDGSTIDEPTLAEGYRRAEIGNYPTSWTQSGYYEVFNTGDILWPTVPGDGGWGPLAAFGLLDAPDLGAGRLLLCGTLNPPLQPAPFTVLRVRTGQMVVTVSSMTPSYQPT